MKEKIIIVLILNLGMFGFSLFVFIAKGLFPTQFILWKFLASMVSLIIFGSFVFLLVRQLIRIH